jgi:hypothetical protein
MAATLIKEKGMSIPTFICDTCGRPITDAAQGFVIWRPSEDYASIAELRFIHKSRCDKAPGQIDRLPCSMSLTFYLTCLLANVKFDRKAADKEARLAEEMGL